MPKATTLTPEALKPSTPYMPKSVMSPRSTVKPKPEKKITEPMQLRLPPEECISIKVDATQRNMSHSDFMLACYHVCKQKNWLPPLSGQSK